MPFLSSISEWLKQSDQLIRAYPTTTRITTKYAIAPPSSKSRKRKRPADAAAANTTSDDAAAAAAAAAPRATLVLKTYDPVSGACLKYKTDQAAEANRLVRSLSALARDMAGLEVDVDAVLDAPVEAADVAGATAVEGGTVAAAGAALKGDAGGGADGQGKRKKKKGKK